MPPIAGILDSFNRADAATLGASWLDGILAGYASLSVASNQASNGSAAFKSNYWATAFAENQEMYCTMTGSTVEVSLWLRLTKPGSGKENAYRVLFDPGASLAYITKWIAGAETQIGGNVSVASAAGDAFLFRAIDTTISLHRKPSGGSWAEVDSRTDHAVGPGGFVGVLVNNTAASVTLDEFGGGSLTATPRPGPSCGRSRIYKCRARRRRNYA